MLFRDTQASLVNYRKTSITRSADIALEHPHSSLDFSCLDGFDDVHMLVVDFERGIVVSSLCRRKMKTDVGYKRTPDRFDFLLSRTTDNRPVKGNILLLDRRVVASNACEAQLFQNLIPHAEVVFSYAGEERSNCTKQWCHHLEVGRMCRVGWSVV